MTTTGEEDLATSVDKTTTSENKRTSRIDKSFTSTVEKPTTGGAKTASATPAADKAKEDDVAKIDQKS